MDQSQTKTINQNELSLKASNENFQKDITTQNNLNKLQQSQASNVSAEATLEQSGVQKQAEVNLLFLEDDMSYKDIILRSFILLQYSFASISTYLGIGYLNLAQMICVKLTNDTDNIASFGLGITWINATSYAVIMTINDGIRNISSQAYGAKKYKLLGFINNQAISVSMVVFLLTLPIILYTKDILVFCGITESIALKSQEFTMYAIPSLLGSVFFETSRQFLFSQKIFHVHMYGQLIAAFIHPLWCYIFILHYDLGMKGAGIARSITFILSYLIVYAQIKYYEYGNKCYSPYRFLVSFKGWFSLLSVALPAGGTNYLKWLSIEFLTIMVGNLSNANALAGHSAFFSINMFFSMFAKGIQTSINTFVGNAIGEKKKKLAQNLSSISVVSCFLLCLSILIIGKSLQPLFIYLLTTSPQMKAQFNIAYNMYIIIDIWCNFLQQVQAGILCGMNRQNDTITYYFFTFLFLQFIVAYIFGFYCGFGLYGIYLGRITAGVVNSLCFMYIISNVDLDQEISQVSLRVERDKKFQLQILELEKIDQSEFKEETKDVITGMPMTQDNDNKNIANTFFQNQVPVD